MNSTHTLICLSWHHTLSKCSDAMHVAVQKKQHNAALSFISIMAGRNYSTSSNWLFSSKAVRVNDDDLESSLSAVCVPQQEGLWEKSIPWLARGLWKDVHMARLCTSPNAHTQKLDIFNAFNRARQHNTNVQLSLSSLLANRWPSGCGNV